MSIKLKGKAKTEFYDFLRDESECIIDVYEGLPEMFQQIIVIQWLDSVDIHVTVSFLLNSFYYNVKEINEDPFISPFGNYNRKEATSKAIEKALKIYNNKKHTKNGKIFNKIRGITSRSKNFLHPTRRGVCR